MIRDKHPLAGKRVILKLSDPSRDPDNLNGRVYCIEDYWQNVGGGSWKYASGNPAALKYAMRSGVSNLPLDDEVVYGKVGAFGHLIHVSELGEEVK